MVKQNSVKYKYVHGAVGSFTDQGSSCMARIVEEITNFLAAWLPTHVDSAIN